ncbi:multicopper oxidase domain-containing protein [Dactylosporangium sp. CA-233914]|uniref:multicopper oxidase domain-containing protein n=1 Tax=Dactylosporangium sp. CA-233914 TaxID=3239934 RepID=UPI003D8F0167
MSALAPAPTGRARWHRRAGLLPAAYLAALVVLALVHPLVPTWRWLAIHLLLLGAATNAIVIWSAHFTAAVLRLPAPAHRRAESLRLLLLNAGVVAVLAGGGADRPRLGVGGAVAVFAAVAAHLGWLAARLRTALPARFAVTVRYYLGAAVALLTGIPAGAWMLVADDDARPRVLLLHAHVNLLGWVMLTVLGTVLTLWPTILRTRMDPAAVAAVRAALPVALTATALLAAGVLAWWPLVCGAGLAGFALALLMTAGPAARAAWRKPPESFAGWSIAAGAGWLLVSLAVDAATLLTAGSPDAAADRFGAVLTPLLIGSVAQILLGALAYLLPMALGGGPAPVRRRTAALERHWPQRLAMTNAALVVFLLPVGPYVRITTSLLLLAALVQFLLPAARMLLSDRIARSDVARPDVARSEVALSDRRLATVPERSDRPLGAIATGIALVVLAVLTGAAAQHVTGGRPAATSTPVTPTGHTTTVAVTVDDMRFRPATITVPAGDRLVIELTNADDRRHDLILATGPKTGAVGPGRTVRLDAGVIGGPVEGWCSLPGHRQAGMTLVISTTTGHDGHTAGAPPAPAAPSQTVDTMADPGPGFHARDAAAPITGTGRVHTLALHVQEVRLEVAPGVSQTMWTYNGTVPGPVLRGRIGDTFEITLVNDGIVDHGIDFHAGALAPDVPMRPIEPGQSLTYRFTATKAGIWMYHCSTMPMLLHIGNGMYGAVIIDPPDLAPVDHEYVLVQSELYLGGDLGRMQAEHPDAVMFNGYAAQYVHRPLTARAGDRVRIWVLDAGPNRDSSFHVVGAQFDTVYAEGRYQLRPAEPGGAQVLTLGPAAGGFVETVFPEPGRYPFVTHLMADADRGARGIIAVAGR